jgi:hypothetical protein
MTTVQTSTTGGVTRLSSQAMGIMGTGSSLVIKPAMTSQGTVTTTTTTQDGKVQTVEKRASFLDRPGYQLVSENVLEPRIVEQKEGQGHVIEIREGERVTKS